MIKRKIWYEEVNKKGFEKYSFKECCEMIGFVIPSGEGKKIEWDVVMIDGIHTCKDQDTAEIMAQNETIIAMMLKNKGKKK
jgi:hypothetical protein